jgi:hypothetical protein
MSLTKAQAKLLQRIIINRSLGSGCIWVNAYCIDKNLLDQIKAEHPDAISFLYGGSVQTVGDHVGCVCFHTETAACDLLDEYNKTAVAGFDGVIEVEDGRGFTQRKNFHYRAESKSKLRGAIRRGVAFYHKFEIVELRPLTHAQWVTAYGWGPM